MRNYTILVILGVLTLLQGCQEPDALLPSVSREGLNSIVATFQDGTGEFIGTLEENEDRVVVPIPYFFPPSSNNRVTEDQLENMRVRAVLDDNVTLDPPLLYMDLTQENKVLLTDQRKESREIIITGEIRKSSDAFIEEFSIPSLNLSGVINENTNVISLVSVEDIGEVLADFRISPHASISPDPTEVALNYDEEVEVTVTAHDGETQNVYTIRKEIPEKLPSGIRPGSGRLLFAKTLRGDIGIQVDNLTGGIAATNDYVVINTRNENSVVLDAKTGEVVSSLDLGPAKGPLTNFYATADSEGNILVNNLSPNDGSFKIWKVAGIDDAPEEFIEWVDAPAVGRKVSIQGSLDSDAIISAPLHGGGQSFARWVVNGGILESQSPEIITMSGLAKGWTTNVDLVYTSASDPTSDYFVASYSDNTFAWVNGRTNELSLKLDEISVNFIPNAVDYIEFNNASFAALNWVNSFTWGAADGVWLLDVTTSATFQGNLADNSSPAIVWSAPFNTYGPNAIGGPANANGTGDVAMTVSEDGYYLYLYFMFTNGYVVGYQFDAIDI